jgi:hypothetical protein
MPEKSGMGAALCVPLLAGPTAGVTACPQAGAAAAVANAASEKQVPPPHVHDHLPLRSAPASGFYPKSANCTRAVRRYLGRRSGEPPRGQARREALHQLPPQRRRVPSGEVRGLEVVDWTRLGTSARLRRHRADHGHREHRLQGSALACANISGRRWAQSSSNNRRRLSPTGEPRQAPPRSRAPISTRAPDRKCRKSYPAPGSQVAACSRPDPLRLCAAVPTLENPTVETDSVAGHIGFELRCEK